MLIKYNISDMENCEYIVLMQKAYFKRPNQSNGRCDGFKNGYSGSYSKVCKNCVHLTLRILCQKN